MSVTTLYINSQETEAGRSLQIQGQPVLHKKNPRSARATFETISKMKQA